MRKVAAIFILTFLLFCIEFFLFNYVSSWFVPNLLLLLIIFVNLWLGIRYSILTAVVAGLLKESYSVSFFGFYIFIFIVCAYVTSILMRYIYQKGSGGSRFLLVTCIVFLSVILQFILKIGTPYLWDALWVVLLPELILTLFLTEFVFQQLRLCASKFFV